MDRSKQKYFVSRHTNENDQWSVCNIDGEYICDFPEYFYDKDLINKICMTDNDKKVKQLVKSIPKDVLDEHNQNLKNMGLW